ncbi:MAG TPA: hypothetical protein VIS10_01275 [Anaerolineales bacterium]
MNIVKGQVGMQEAHGVHKITLPAYCTTMVIDIDGNVETLARGFLISGNCYRYAPSRAF